MTAVLIVGVPVGAAFVGAIVVWGAAVVVMHRIVSRMTGEPA